MIRFLIPAKAWNVMYLQEEKRKSFCLFNGYILYGIGGVDEVIYCNVCR
jgi:hypothetical protein